MIILKENIDSLMEMFQISISESKPFIFPTDTIYGMGAPISNTTANQLIYDIKKRPLNKPFPILAGSIDQMALIADISSLSSECYNFMKNNYQNFTTFILNAKKIDSVYQSGSKVAVRIPARDTLQTALNKSNIFLSATSVNESGRTELNKLSEIVKQFPQIDLFIYGKIFSNKSSYIFDISDKKIIQIR